MKWSLKITNGRRNSGVSGLGSNVVITGKCDDGTPAMYKYYQPSSQEGGSRTYKVGDQRGKDSDFTR